MPGRLMDEDAAPGSLDLKKDRSQAQGASHQQALPVKSPADTQVNGTTRDGPNGVLTNGASSEQTHTTGNGEPSNMAVATSSAEGPPPLDQSWRSREQNKSLGLLMNRVAQQCYFDLNKTLDDMSAIPTAPSQPQLPNGVGPHTGPDTSEPSVKKKRMIMDFANDQRDRFIKTLVLSDWSRNEEEKARMIDVKVWLDKQTALYRQAEDAVARAKMNMQQAKVPNPNIEGAMEVLATGKASWVPDLGYIRPKKLSAKQLLKTMRDMNVILGTRLSLHEDLPFYFRDYSIADGRVTFMVKDEFEVDLSVADEDPATQLYFIDIRLSFEPTTPVLDDRIRGFLEGKINVQLASKGLQGCYDFLHNFVLTHKLTILQDQATELTRGKWFDCIKIEKLRRSLVVQYWAGLPGPKSWIEIGISSGKQTTTSIRRPATPHISVRWFQRSVEIKGEKLEFDWQQLDVEKCLMHVIERHTASILDDLRTRICALVPADAPFKAKVSDAGGCQVLSLSLPSLRQPIEVRIEPVTGQYSITPPSTASLNIERRLNNHPTADPARWLAGLPCAVVQDQVFKQADLLRWSPVKHLVRQDNLTAVFGEKLQHFSIFTPSRAWSDDWALAVTFSLQGEKWWAAELEERRSELPNGTGRIIKKVTPVDPAPDGQRKDISTSRDTLSQVARRAVGDVAVSTLSAQLKGEHIPHSMQKVFPQGDCEGVERHDRIFPTALFISFSKLRKGMQRGKWKPWAHEAVRLSHHGLVHDARGEGVGSKQVRHDLRLSLDPGKFKELHKHIQNSGERDLALNPHGGVALKFITPFGQPFIKKMRQRLQTVEQLDQCANILKQRHFVCGHLSLSRLQFTYHTTPELSVEMTFPTEAEGITTLKFHPHDNNPHRRVKVMMEQAFNATDSKAFDIFTHTLSLTLPVLQTFNRLEAKDPVCRVIAIHPRNTTWYSIAYHPPLPRCTFTLRTRIRREGEDTSVKWIIEDFHSSIKGQNLPEELNTAMQELYKESAEHWEGMGSAIVADAQGAAEALEKLDGIVRRFESVPGQPQAAESTQQQQQPTDLPKGTSQSNGQASGQANGQARQNPKQSKPSTSSKSSKPVKQEPDLIMLD
ncbi:mediator complex subunit [Saxophila tyrrhenica]|uniref:Mediator of RNA polymerase II transcription subunit 14 n=1 Tax=Saxophila tyrrhenica TaxID=1690608 RepID=A0AAV9PL10_9PEZI|nr:mediator complex subunit [Saxophila tyrrhenica]